MGFLDGLLGMFGVGQPKLTIVTSAQQAAPGQVIDATLTLTGGKRPLPLNAFELCIRQKEEKINPDGTKMQTWNSLGKIVWPQGGKVVGPGEVVSIAMKVQVPSDTAPTGGPFEYKIEGTADVPGLDATADQPLLIAGPPDAQWAREDLTKYLVLPTERASRHSSVKSDFRLLRLTDGFVTTWKNELSCRNLDGTQRWRLPGWGRSFTLSPDGKQLLVSNNEKQLGIVDVTSGQVVGGPSQMSKWPGDLAWLPGGALVVGSDEGTTTMQPNFFPIGVSFGGDQYLGGIAASTDKRYFASYPNSNYVKWTEVPTGDHGKIELQSPGDLLPNKDGSLLAVRGHDQFHLLATTPAFKHQKTIDVPGLRGVRYLGQAEHSCTRFEPMPRVSDDGQSILVQDGSGQLWLVNRGGDPTYVFPREVVDMVEDTAWVGADEFIALTNDGKVCKLSAKGGPAVWTQQDV